MRMTIAFRFRFAGGDGHKDYINVLDAMFSSCGAGANDGMFEGNTRL
jgi:hypothetical protein